MNTLEMAIFDVVTLMPQCALMGWYNTRLVKMKKVPYYIISHTFFLILTAFMFDLKLINGMIRMAGVFGGGLIIAGLFLGKKERLMSEIVIFIHYFVANLCEGFFTLVHNFIAPDINYLIIFDLKTLIVIRIGFLGVYIIVAQCLCYLVHQQKKCYIKDEVNVYMGILAVQLIALVLFMGDYSGKSISNIFNMYLVMILCLFCIAMDVAIYLLLHEFDRYETEKCRENQLNIQIKFQEQRREELQNDIDRAEQIKSHLLEGIDEAKRVLFGRDEAATNDSLKKLESEMAVQALYCKNRVIDALLSEKVKICPEHSIRLELDLELDKETEKEMNIQNVDLCIIVANLMDNAIRACEESNINEPYIRLVARKRGKYLVFHQENTTDGMVENRKKGALSEHGLGLGIIECVAEKYEGCLEIRQEDGVFHTIVMLKMMAL